MAKIISRRLLAIPLALYAVAVFGLFGSGADMALGRFEHLPLPATLAAVLSMLPLVAVAFTSDLLRRTRSPLAETVFRNATPIVMFFLLVSLSLVLALHPTAYWEENGKWIFLNAYGFLIFLLAMTLPLLRAVREWFRTCVFFALLLILGSIATDLVSPGYFSSVMARAAGFPGNSNYASVVVMTLTAALLRYEGPKSVRWDGFVFALGGLGVFATLSRSGMLEFAALFLFFLYQGFFKKGLKPKTVMAVSGTLFGFALLFAIAVPLLLENTEMFSKYKTRFTRASQYSQIDDGSSLSRLAAAKDAIRLINEAPLLGHGTGFSRRMEELPHNLYLQQWVNNGVLGLAAYLGLLVSGFLVFRKYEYLPGQGVLVVAAVASFFSHNVLDQRPFLIIFGCTLTLAVEHGRQSRLREASRHPTWRWLREEEWQSAAAETEFCPVAARR